MFNFTKPPGITAAIFRSALPFKELTGLPPNVINLHQDDLFYFGRTDPEGNASILSEINLSQIKSLGAEALFAVDFVADAYNDFVTAYNLAISQGRLSTKSLIVNLNAQRAWEPVDSAYDEYVHEIYRVFVAGYLKEGFREQKLRTFKDFLKLFFDYLQLTAHVAPFSYTGYLLSRAVSPHISGLFISLLKETTPSMSASMSWLQDINFSAYADLAKKHGFYIDVNQPWRLVANLGSKPMAKYMERYGVSRDNVYYEYYLPSHMLDVKAFKFYTKEFYDTYRIAYPNVTTVDGATCTSRNYKRGETPIPENETQYTVVPREILSRNEYDSRYGAIFWLMSYFDLRVKEAQVKWSSNTHSKIIKKAIKIQKGFDIGTAIRYINQQVRDNTPKG